MISLAGKKTHIVAVGLLLSGIGGFIIGEMTVVEAIQFVLNGLGLSALRMGVASK